MGGGREWGEVKREEKEGMEQGYVSGLTSKLLAVHRGKQAFLSELVIKGHL